MNIVSISGRLVYEPEIKYTSNQKPYISTRIAVDRHDQNKTTDFFVVRIYGKGAEFVKKYFHKGDPIEVTGKLQTESYTKQDGTKVEGVFIFVNECGFTLSKSQGKPQTSETPAETPAEQTAPSDDVPFEI